MSPGAHTRSALVAGLAVLALAACTTGTASVEDDRSRPGAATGKNGRPQEERPRGDTAPNPGTAESPGAGEQPDDSLPRAADQPLVIVTHHTRGLREVSLRQARRIVQGRSRFEVASGPPMAAIRSVVRDPGVLAVVPAEALGPRVRALRVGGVDPVRRPERYPLRTEEAAAPAPVVRVTVVGDIMLGRGVAARAETTGDPAHALRPMASRLAKADITVGNLESTLSRAGSPTQGDDSFAADPAVVRGLRNAGFDALSLANNHAGDFGDRALVQTVRRLRAGGIATFGAGANVRSAWRPAVIERDGVRFGFVGFNAIGETPAVAPGQPGAVSIGMPPRTGPLDRSALRRFEAAVRRLDRRVDVVVALPHWGTQYTNRPEPIQRQVARRLVRAGVDVVVGGHPHWLQGVTVVEGRLVAHSLGNFVFDMDFMRRTQEGAILELTFWGEELKAADFVPYVMDDDFAPRVVSGRRAAQVLEVMRATSGPAHQG
ncbi:MAG TPA: CapA family protein [Nocardioidaceae bacterium]|nr:CapA family protein [Nocardioidaceae bacterium]